MQQYRYPPAPDHYTRIITSAKRQLDSIGLLSASAKDIKTLKTYYKDRIKTAIANRDTANARYIDVIDAENL